MHLDKNNIRTVNGTLFVRDDKKEEKTKGGIILADTADTGERMFMGTVLNVSAFLLEDGSYKSPEISVGDRIVFGQHAGAGCVWKDDTDNETYRMIKWNEVLAVIKNEKS